MKPEDQRDSEREYIQTQLLAFLDPRTPTAAHVSVERGFTSPEEVIDLLNRGYRNLDDPHIEAEIEKRPGSSSLLSFLINFCYLFGPKTWYSIAVAETGFFGELRQLDVDNWYQSTPTLGDPSWTDWIQVFSDWILEGYADGYCCQTKYVTRFDVETNRTVFEPKVSDVVSSYGVDALMLSLVLARLKPYKLNELDRTEGVATGTPGRVSVSLTRIYNQLVDAHVFPTPPKPNKEPDYVKFEPQTHLFPVTRSPVSLIKTTS